MEIVSLNSSCMGVPDQGGCHLSRMHCHLRHDPPVPLHEPTVGDNPAHTRVVALSVFLEERNFRGNCDGLVVLTWPQDLCLLLDCNSFTNLAVSVFYIYTKPHVQWSRRGGHDLLFSHGMKCIHIFYLCRVIVFSSSPALEQADDKMVMVIIYSVQSAVPQKCHTKLHFSQAVYKRQIAEIT